MSRWIEPEWNYENEFVDYEFWAGLEEDANTDSRPMINKENNGNLEVESPLEIANQFDSIAYSKGGSILRFSFET